MNIAIIEDNPVESNRLKDIINNWSKSEKVKNDIFTYSSAEAFLKANETIPKLSAIFLDIEMSGMSGIELAHNLRNMNYDGEIIIITAFREYVFQGYNVHALNYLLKPAEPVSIGKCLDDVYKKALSEVYTYHFRSDVISIPFADIICFVSNLHNVDIVTADKTYSEHKSFGEVVNSLPSTFVQVHRSFVVNLAHVYSISKNTIKLSNGTEASIGRSFAKDLSTKFINYSTRLD